MMEIRRCREEDITSAGALYDKVVLWLDAHINYPKWMYKIYPSEEYAREMTEAASQYICLDGDRIVAAFVLNDDPQADYQRGVWSRYLPDGTYMVLHALAIDPEYQGKGLGSEIVRFCIDEAKTRGYKAFRLDIVPDNIPARRLYEKFGFEYTGDDELGRGIEEIPLFSLFELNWPDEPKGEA